MIAPYTLTCHAPLLAIDSAGKGVIVDLKVTLVVPGRGYIDVLGRVKEDVVSSFKLALIYASIFTGVDYRCCDFIIHAPVEVEGLSATLFFYILLLNMLGDRTCPINISSTGIIGPGGIVGSVGGFQEKIRAASESGLQVYAHAFQSKNLGGERVQVKGVYSIFDVFQDLISTEISYKTIELEKTITTLHSAFKETYALLHDRASSIIHNLERVGWEDSYLNASRSRLIHASKVANETEKYYVSSSLAFQALIYAYTSHLNYLYNRAGDELVVEISRILESTLNSSRSIITKIENTVLSQERVGFIDLLLLDLLSVVYERAIEVQLLINKVLGEHAGFVDLEIIELSSRSLARVISAEAWLNITLKIGPSAQVLKVSEMEDIIKYIEDLWDTTKNYLTYIGANFSELDSFVTSSERSSLMEYIKRAGIISWVSIQIYSSPLGIRTFAHNASTQDAEVITDLGELLLAWVYNLTGFVSVEPALVIDLARTYLQLDSDPNSVIPLIYSVFSKLMLSALTARAALWVAHSKTGVDIMPYILLTTTLLIWGVILMYVFSRRGRFIAACVIKQ